MYLEFIGNYDLDEHAVGGSVDDHADLRVLERDDHLREVPLEVGKSELKPCWILKLKGRFSSRKDGTSAI